MVNQYQHRRNH